MGRSRGGVPAIAGCEPGLADTHLQLGHVLKLQGKTPAAQAAYLHAFALDPAMPFPTEELAALGWSPRICPGCASCWKGRVSHNCARCAKRQMPRVTNKIGRTRRDFTDRSSAQIQRHTISTSSSVTPIREWAISTRRAGLLLGAGGNTLGR